jgi:hypothetical protein
VFASVCPWNASFPPPLHASFAPGCWCPAELDAEGDQKKELGFGYSSQKFSVPTKKEQ